MRNKWTLWRILLSIVSLLPVIWWALFQDKTVIQDYNAITYTIGIVTWLVSYTMLAITFVLSTRRKWIEDLFWWLDKMYIVHAVVGSIAFLFMLAHPIFLILKYIPENTYLAAVYLLPGSHWSINFGVWAFLFMIVLMGITLFIKKIKYHHRKASHTFFSLAFLFVAIHVFTIKSDLATIYFPWYYLYAFLIGVMGIGAYIFTIGKKYLQNQKFFTYTIIQIYAHNNDFTEIVCEAEGNYMKYEAWQFAFIKFINAEISGEAHPFSFASYNPKNNKFRMIIKHSGDYTRTLAHLKVGDKALVEWPYGKFTIDMKKPKQIWIGWWIGITPFIAMAGKIITNPWFTIDLYYLVKTKEEFAWLEHLQEIAKVAKGVRIIPRISSEQWHLTLQDIWKLSWNLGEYIYYMCGPDTMKNTFTQWLQTLGIRDADIHSEWYNFKI